MQCPNKRLTSKGAKTNDVLLLHCVKTQDCANFKGVANLTYCKYLIV